MKHLRSGWLMCLLTSLALAGQLSAQTKKPPPKKTELAKDKDPGQPVQFKGDAKMSVHTWKMEKGSMYRITVKAESFTPEVAVDGHRNNMPFISPVLPPVGAPNPVPAKNRTAQMIFSPPATREYTIKVGHLPGADVGDGPLPYTLTIERAAFKPLLDTKNKIEVNEQIRAMEQGKIYSIAVTGKGFAPEVQIMDGDRSMAVSGHGRWFGFGPDAEFISSITFKPARSMDYRILIGVGPVAPERQIPLAYSVQFTELKVELTVADKLTIQDPLYARRGGPHKVHTIKLQADKKYQIDLTSLTFDTYLFLEDSDGNVIMEDDDGGEGLNARIIFQPTRTDTYRIVATTFGQGAPSKAPGDYTLSVTENPHAQPRFALPPFGQGDFKK
jgi:hypothetical protein